MKTLIVLAHPEPRSFNGQWAEATRAACAALGHEVMVADLCAEGFDPVERAAHYPAPLSPFDPLKNQEQASKAAALPEDVRRHVANIRAADRIVFHFPMWWFGPPAILKGWMDRCLPHGELHTGSERFDTGRLRHVSALFCVSTGGTEAQSGPDGKEGDTRLLLWPLAQTLRYCGVEVLQPRIVHGVHGYHRPEGQAKLGRALEHMLATQGQAMAEWDSAPRIPFNADSDFDESQRLKDGAPSHSPFIRKPD
ncbi:NAD(P)H-dependent oxidoreductase [Oceaniglobus roseus]|uniref:NAD(P)H-dependent oxidoreductase n=1 Tax=Oceaniglobus roseus TaxID=1737570 RepID=UPI000C7ED13C|nr:NAD(P)H-dependent oxidoreductase [Kandeliimicrobium roseum]